MARLTSMARVMTSIVPGNFFREVPGGIEGQRKGVAAVARAIKASDPKGAADAFARLLRAQGELVVQLLDQRGLFVEPSAVVPRP